uniref:Zgc:63568 n=1 Tax=Cyprinus carpio TaxID=7962 RepID=A0A8C1W5G2_CYPCA
METEGKCKDAVAWEAEKALSIEEVQVSPPKADEVRIKNNHIFLEYFFHIFLLHYLKLPMAPVGSPARISRFTSLLVSAPSLNTLLCQRTMHQDSPRYSIGQSLFAGLWSVYRIWVSSEHRQSVSCSMCYIFFCHCLPKVESGSKCAAAGASRIIAVNINPDKFEISKTFGATEFVNPKDHSKPIQEVLRELTHGGVDFSIECVGNVGVLRAAVKACIRVVPKLVQDYMSGKLLLDEFGTHRLTLDQVNQAFDLMITEKWSVLLIY